MILNLKGFQGDKTRVSGAGLGVSYDLLDEVSDGFDDTCNQGTDNKVLIEALFICLHS